MIMDSESVVASGRVQQELKGHHESELQHERSWEFERTTTLAHGAAPPDGKVSRVRALIALAAFLALAPAATNSREPGNPFE